MIVERSYLGRPWVQRSTAALLAAVLLLLASVGLYALVPDVARIPGVAGVVVGLVLLVAAHEFVVAKWRRAYLRDLRRLGFAV